MRLSIKDMIISFVLALVAFSLIMAVVGVSIYRSSVPVRTEDERRDASVYLPSHTCRYDFSETVLYYDLNDAGQFQYAVLVGIDTAQKNIVLMPIAGEVCVSYQNAFYRVSNIFQNDGINAIAEMVTALTGIEPGYHRNANLLGVKPSANIDRFYEQVRDIELASHEGYTADRIDVVCDESGFADREKTVRQFFIIETN